MSSQRRLLLLIAVYIRLDLQRRDIPCSADFSGRDCILLGSDLVTSIGSGHEGRQGLGSIGGEGEGYIAMYIHSAIGLPLLLPGKRPSRLRHTVTKWMITAVGLGTCSYIISNPCGGQRTFGKIENKDVRMANLLRTLDYNIDYNLLHRASSVV